MAFPSGLIPLLLMGLGMFYAGCNINSMKKGRGEKLDLSPDRSLTGLYGPGIFSSMNTDEPEKPKGIRWWPAFFIVGLIAVPAWMGYLYFVRAEDRTYQLFVVNASVMLTTVLLLVWWLLFSRARWWLRLFLPALLVGAAIGTLRFDGFTGEMVPMVSLKWDAAQGELAAVSNQVTASTNSEAVNLSGYVVTDTDWPGYRGSGRDGIVKDAQFEESWLKPTELWRIPVGEGWSSFAAVESYVWTQEQHDAEERVICREASTGATIWSHADDARFEEFLGGPGPRATPTYHDGRLYCLGGTGILNCFEAASGKVLWSKDILKEAGASNIEWGMAGSPLVYGETVIVAPGGTNGQSVIAFNLTDGEKKWANGDARASYAAPQVFKIKGADQLLVHQGNGLTAFAPADGSELWSHGWSSAPKINVAQPLVYDESAVFLSVGYGRGSILLDVEKAEDQWSAEERWRSMRLKSKFNPFVQDGNYVYGLDEAYLVCLDLDTGLRTWKGPKFGYGQLLRIGKVLLIQAESGELAFVQADPAEFKEIGRFQAIEGKTWNHPVVANGRLFVRNGKQAACFQLTNGTNGTNGTGVPVI